MTVPVTWFWNEKRYRLARLISEGKTYEAAGAEVGLCEGTVKTYMSQVKEFREHVDNITLENELLTRAGASRLLLKVIEEKLPNAVEDKDTVLSYLKYLHEMADKEEDVVREVKVTFKRVGK